MRSLNRLFALALVLSPVAMVHTADADSARTFKVDSSGGSSIQFVSDAPLEKFTGKSTAVSGEIKVDPDKVSTGKADLAVDAASINTNLKLRDEHLRGENWLDAKKFPQAKLVITPAIPEQRPEST